MTKQTILVIDDREDLTRFCERVMGGEYEFRHLVSAADARRILVAEPTVAAVLLDRDFSQAPREKLIGPPEDARNEGMHVLRWLRREHPGIPIVMVTGFREQGSAVEAADLGVDYLAWEDVIADPGILRARLEHAIETSQQETAPQLAPFRELGIVGSAPSFASVLVAVHQAVKRGLPILLLGETGTGKDCLAFAVHALSGDSTRPFVNVNLASLTPSLIESELFGHARGAFTGADRAHVGRIRCAHEGTLFLNEIGDMPDPLQAKLLTVLERREVVAVGEVRSHPAHFRLVSATSRPLPQLVRQGRFRGDLFYRLAWHMFEIPPLRERREDIPELVRAFLRDSGQGQEHGVAGITREAVEQLCDYPWPGNVRQLRAVVQTASATARYVITLADVREILRTLDAHNGRWSRSLPDAKDAGETTAPDDCARARVALVQGAAACGGSTVSTASSTERDLLQREDDVFNGLSYRQVTERYFRHLLRTTAGKLPEAARLAGIAKATIYEWRDRFSAPPED